MLPKINMVGRLVKDPEQRFTQSGISIVSFDLVSSEKYKEKEDTCFISCTVFAGLGEKVIMPYVKKGDKIYITGKLKQDNWTTQTGDKRSKHTVNVEGVELLNPKADNPRYNNIDDPNKHNVSGNLNRPPNSHTAQTNPPLPDVDMDMENIPFGYIGLSEGGYYAHLI